MFDDTEKIRTISTTVTEELVENAKLNLEKQGLTVSEYINLTLIKAANDEVKYINFLDSSEALNAKRDAENGKVESFNSVEEWEKSFNND
ncbi:RelB [Companilactobacillus mishanensis]|uniref:RelB n=1 Tax=Companilactobacillus mishanensis TaxID=2486008 RepID=A0ABW9P7C4_9LACO|nr:RelB [Companilactobacillus mishanensis]MQS45153.1 RelB [Companilactobacillus mishanensis]MQS89996.1 RelB [Companilactobacillus mishanensis]